MKLDPPLTKDSFKIELPEVGPGLILWQPRGALLRKLIEDYWKDAHYTNGYELLYTPHIARQDLWKTSGHLDFYGENMYSAMEIDEVAYQLKPMNCPFHIGIYKATKHSYREFPVRWCELGTVYRYERTGALHGLMRVRGFTQDDAHIFCRPDQLEEEIFNIIDLPSIRFYPLNCQIGIISAFCVYIINIHSKVMNSVSTGR